MSIGETVRTATIRQRVTIPAFLEAVYEALTNARLVCEEMVGARRASGAMCGACAQQSRRKRRKGGERLRRAPDA